MNIKVTTTEVPDLELVAYGCLRRAVPEASEDHIWHTLEYVRWKNENGLIRLTGSIYNEEPRLLGPFYRKEHILMRLRDELQDAAEKVIKKVSVEVAQKAQALHYQGKRVTGIEVPAFMINALPDFFLGFPVSQTQ